MGELLFVASFESRIGALRVASSERGLVHLALPRAAGCGFDTHQRRHFPDAEVREGLGPNRAAIDQLIEYLEGRRRRFDLRLDLRGTAFQLSVWSALVAIPCGEKRNYAEIARAVGRPRAVRAVGNAAGANPLPIVVPCHRVVAVGGRLGGYAGGGALKARLLAMERDAQAGTSVSNNYVLL
jgi:O-6-methylguanine DNA methyltransferase